MFANLLIFSSAISFIASNSRESFSTVFFLIKKTNKQTFNLSPSGFFPTFSNYAHYIAFKSHILC